MANSKISALTSATTPLAGTETLPIVQSGVTKQVSIANVTAGRSVTMSKVTASGSGELAKLETSGNITAGGLNYLRFYDSVGARGYVGYVGTGALQITGSGDVELQPASGSNVLLTGANITQGTAAKGINFTANTPASGMTSQLLNWYEEGTWTPTDGSGAGLSFTYTAAQMRYTRMGRVVMIQGQITYPATASGSTALIGGLPFTSSANNRAGLALGANTFAAAYGLFISVGSPYIEISKVAGSGAQATNANLSGTTFAFSGTYSV